MALEGPCHQALTGSCARPGESPWRAQASWLLRLSDSQGEGHSLQTICPPGGRGPQAQGALPAHLRAGGRRDAPLPASVQSWVPTSGLALCGERPPCFQGGSEVPSTPSWPCCGECSNRSPSRGIIVPGLSMEPLDKCAQARTLNQLHKQRGIPGRRQLPTWPWCSEGLPARLAPQACTSASWELGSQQGRAASLKSADCCRPAVPAGSTQDPMTSPTGRKTGGCECGRGHLVSGSAGRAAGWGQPPHARSPSAPGTQRHRRLTGRPRAGPSAHPQQGPPARDSRAASCGQDSGQPGTRPTDVPLTFLLATRCSPGTSKGHTAQGRAGTLPGQSPRWVDTKLLSSHTVIAEAKQWGTTESTSCTDACTHMPTHTQARAREPLCPQQRGCTITTTAQRRQVRPA